MQVIWFVLLSLLFFLLSVLVILPIVLILFFHKQKIEQEKKQDVHEPKVLVGGSVPVSPIKVSTNNWPASIPPIDTNKFTIETIKNTITNSQYAAIKKIKQTPISNFVQIINKNTFHEEIVYSSCFDYKGTSIFSLTSSNNETVIKSFSFDNNNCTLSMIETPLSKITTDAIKIFFFIDKLYILNKNGKIRGAMTNPALLQFKISKNDAWIHCDSIEKKCLLQSRQGKYKILEYDKKIESSKMNTINKMIPDSLQLINQKLYFKNRSCKNALIEDIKIDQISKIQKIYKIHSKHCTINVTLTEKNNMPNAQGHVSV